MTEKNDVDIKEVIIENDTKPIVDDAFEGEEGILEIFKGVYAQAKKGSVPHAAFIFKYYYDEESEFPDMPKLIEVTREIIDNEA